MDGESRGDEEKMGRICRSTKKYDQRESGPVEMGGGGCIGTGTWTWGLVPRSRHEGEHEQHLGARN